MRIVVNFFRNLWPRFNFESRDPVPRDTYRLLETGEPRTLETGEVRILE